MADHEPHTSPQRPQPGTDETRPGASPAESPAPTDLATLMKANKSTACVFVWAPAGRCGTGLLQRLITSSRDVLVYGEDRYLTRSLPEHILSVSQMGNESQTSAQRLARGDYTNWSPDALPDKDAYLERLITSVYAVAETYRRTSARYGFARWGTKLPEVNVNCLRILQQLFPYSRHIFIYRNVHDVLRSYKGRCWIKNLMDVQHLAQTWARNMNSTLRAAGQLGIMPVEYEGLVADPAGQSHRLAAFLDARPFDLDVFAHKVNTWTAEDTTRGGSPTQYVNPKELTGDEEHILAQIPPEVFRLAGYAPPVPA